jgi:hypothetical protein
VCDPDEPLDRRVLELRPSEHEAAEDTSQKLAQRRPVGASGARNDLVELPGIDDEAGVLRLPDLVPVARAELDAPRDSQGRRAEPCERRNRAGEAGVQLVRLLGRYPPLLPVVASWSANIGAWRPFGNSATCRATSPLGP